MGISGQTVIVFVGMCPEILVRVLSLRQFHYPDGKPCSDKFLPVSGHSLDSCLICVTDEYRCPRPLLDCTDLLLSQCCSEGCNGIADSYLMQPDDIRITLAKDYSASCRNLSLRIEPSEQHISLMEELRLSGVQIFRDIAFSGDVPPGESCNISCAAVYGEDYPLSESIVICSVVLIPLDKPRLQEHIPFPSLGRHVLQQGILPGRISDAERIDREILPASLQYIFLGCRSLGHGLTEEFLCIPVDGHEFVSQILPLPFLRGRLPLLILYVQFPGKILQSLGVCHVPVVHYECDGIP